MAISEIRVVGARQHNLKNISVRIPRQTFTVITGLSGSGKSSLAFDTLYAEGQRRYVETLSAYARQFLDQLERPDVDAIEGLSPAIAIEQKTTSHSPRSTVGTVTEIYDYLRLLWASIGEPHCPKCGQAIVRQSADQIVETVLSWAQEGGAAPKIMVLAPLVRGRKGEFRQELAALPGQGFTRVRIDGEMRHLEEEPLNGERLDKRRAHTIEVVVDRLFARPAMAARLRNSVTTALAMAKGLVVISRLDGAGDDGQERMFSELWACPQCGLGLAKLEPRSFSFNSRYGACERCEGLGSRYEFDPAKFITHPGKPLLEGGLGPGSSSQAWQREITAFARSRRIPIEKPYADLKPQQQEDLLHGAGDFTGVIGHLQEMQEDTTMDVVREWLLGFMSSAPCPACHGQRLRPESLAVQIQGRSIADFTALALTGAAQAAAEMEQAILAHPRQKQIAGRLIAEVRERIGFLLEVGLGYLTLDRPSATLAGGEAQRIRLASQIGSRLRGVLYVLDEPSIGLHPRDNGRLLRSLLRLRDLGNTVLVVEHDRETIEQADHVLDLGPGAGRHGGELVASGAPAMIAATPGSLTGDYLAGRAHVNDATPQRRPVRAGQGLRVVGARARNLHDLDVFIPAGLLTVVTGVSGAGKSTLVNDILYPALAQRYFRALAAPGEHDRIEGMEQFDKVVRVDQDPIGRTPRSNPATYTGLFGHIRDLFAELPEARVRGYGKGRFSFNVRGGRCEACLGEGVKRIVMNFLPDVQVRCEVCGGRRYNQETLAVKFKDHSIADVLDLSVEEARELFANIPHIAAKLATLCEVGLGYIHLGQSSTTLSGGEAQRIKLAKELSRRATGKTIYLLDEPTTGLHFADVKHLLHVLNALVALGNTVLVIEHNLDVMWAADWIIDLGPEGGAGGGRLVAEGPPELITTVPASLTGRALRTDAGQPAHAGMLSKPM
ncbi:MAG: excinuclease ABC subunit UvrA [Acidobacteria bacterium]|nr:MAG: excinuclease ABC subunit UvrA [Acidobacteriota bacterium]